MHISEKPDPKLSSKWIKYCLLNFNAPEPNLIFSEPNVSHAHQQEYPENKAINL